MSAPALTPSPGGLSEREVEVVGLLTGGLRLALQSRAELGALAERAGLVG